MGSGVGCRSLVKQAVGAEELPEKGISPMDRGRKSAGLGGFSHFHSWTPPHFTNPPDRRAEG